jgi:serine/threonine protein phosphatase PrpC
LGVVYLATDRGKVHARNEDAVAAAVLDDTAGAVLVVTVCDGVSTSGDPQAASGAAVRAGVEACLAALTVDAPPAQAVLTGVEAAAHAVRGVADPNGNAPSCTYVSAVLCPRDNGEFEITVANVGDSRAYWLSREETGPLQSQRLTIDDSWAQALVDSGAMDENAAMRDPRAHALVRWLGADSDHRPGDSRVSVRRVRGPGALLLCSDGLWNYLSDPAALAALALGADPARAARALVDYALDGGGNDNITVALAPVDGDRLGDEAFSDTTPLSGTTH